MIFKHFKFKKILCNVKMHLFEKNGVTVAGLYVSGIEGHAGSIIPG